MGRIHLVDSTSKSKAAVQKILLSDHDRVFIAVKQVFHEQPGTFLTAGEHKTVSFCCLLRLCTENIW